MKTELEEVFGTVEAVKTVSDLFMPITGLQTFNELENNPQLINSELITKDGQLKSIMINH